MMMGPQIKRGTGLNNVSIVDLAPTILHALGVPIPQDMDGRPLVEAFATDDCQGRPRLSAVPASLAQEREAVSYTAEEARQVEQRLRQMGYLG
jgi:arylsulfatase A-like enzyme